MLFQLIIEADPGRNSFWTVNGGISELQHFLIVIQEKGNIFLNNLLFRDL